MGILEDILVQVDEFDIPCKFMVIDMDESSQVPIILRRLFLATAGVVIYVAIGKISFQLCEEKVIFCFPPSIALLLITPSVPGIHVVPATFAAISGLWVS